MLRTTLAIFVAVLLGASLGANPPSRAQESASGLSGWGVVLLHGKQGSPANYNILGGPMKAHGAVVVTPLMAYARSRMYDARLAHEDEIIDAALDDLRAGGFTKVALGGYSEGGGHALTYAAEHRRRLDALIIMAPVSHAGQDVSEELQRASRLISEGQGDVRTIFVDSNAARVIPATNFYVTATPKVYVDWHDTVLATAAKAARVPPSVPVLWINALHDFSLTYQRAAASALPKNPRRRYVELDTYHLDVPDEAVSTVLEWFESLGH
jgi:pimeloyl-ACP methyl ester carboxylesterase